MKLIETAVQAALEAGKAILDVYDQDFEVEFKADESPLTSADKVSHDIIVRALSETSYPVLSEESGDLPFEERKAWKTYWLVDPIDGTKEFIQKNGEFTVNVALVENGSPVMGVVYAPVLDVLYCGMSVNGQGISVSTAWKATSCLKKSFAELRDSSEPLQVSCYPQSGEKRPIKVVASRSHCNDETRRFVAELEERYGDAELVSRGSSLKLCMIAEGSADIYPRIAPTMEWDTAAAHAVVSAAGGRVFGYNASVSAILYEIENSDIQDLSYNKEHLLNDCFVVSGLLK